MYIFQLFNAGSKLSRMGRLVKHSLVFPRKILAAGAAASKTTYIPGVQENCNKSMEHEYIQLKTSHRIFRYSSIIVLNVQVKTFTQTVRIVFFF